MTLLHCACITFLGNFFNQVYFPFDCDFQCLEVFSSTVFMCLTAFSEVGSTEFSQHGFVGLRLCVRLISSGKTDRHELQKWLFVCALSPFEAFVCISCWATVFSNVALKRIKSTLKKIIFFIEEYVFPSKVIIKETVMVGRHSCVAQCWPFAS